MESMVDLLFNRNIQQRWAQQGKHFQSKLKSMFLMVYLVISLRVLLLFLLFLHVTQEVLNLGPMNALRGKWIPWWWMPNLRCRSYRFTLILKAVICNNNQKLINSALNPLLGYFSASVVLMNILIPPQYILKDSTLTWITVL